MASLSDRSPDRLPAVAVDRSPRAASRHGPEPLRLDGEWECGLARHYTRRVSVPGLAGDPRRIETESVWYRRRVRLPAGAWSSATLILNGARFAPRVYVDGALVSRAAGGMAPTEHRLNSPAVVPGAQIVLEVELLPLDQVSAEDASVIPEADRWRSNVSACLWDRVVLRFHHQVRLARLLPAYDAGSNTLRLRFELDGEEAESRSTRLALWLEGPAGERIGSDTVAVGSRGEVRLALADDVVPWSPETPQLYHLRFELWRGESSADRGGFWLGLKEFTTEGEGFRLNGAPVVLRAASVVWHRWPRDPESAELAFDVAWFEQNIVKRLKAYGANTLRFHLGMPPEALLDLCDRHGLLVQVEWIFFHGLKASESSMVEQWRAWLDLCVRHPSTAIVHAWNETSPEELVVAWAALNQLLPEYPPLVVGHRDVIHLHKYWWSLFENLGLYYDSAEQFSSPIMADEFGGNYLDGQGEPGGYPTLRESFLRFLGPNATAGERLAFQAQANGKVAEYWRRLGAAGFSPFCALGPPEDGNHWFLGPLVEAREKPVWAALAAAWAPRSVSLELWDRNFRPGHTLSADVHCFNDTGTLAHLVVHVMVCEAVGGEPVGSVHEHRLTLQPYARRRLPVTLGLPWAAGDWVVRAELTRGGVSEKPIRSDWAVRTLSPVWPGPAPTAALGVPDGESELREFLITHGLRVVKLTDPAAAVIVTGRVTADRLEADAVLPDEVRSALRAGRSWLALDLGPTPLGQGYGEDLGPLQAAPTVAEPRTHVRRLDDLEILFHEAPEPESHLHPATEQSVWPERPVSLHWMWNGLRGGLVVPACTFEIASMSRESLIERWAGRGADVSRLGDMPYFAYELGGVFAFAGRPDDVPTREALRRRVRFLVEDAPSLAVSINPEAPIRVTNLSAAHRAADATEVQACALARCGKGLMRTPVWRVTRKGRPGCWILSQSLTAGRLGRGALEPGLYGRREDPAAGQFVLDLLSHVLETTPLDANNATLTP